MTAAERRQFFWFFAIAFLVLAAGFGLRDPWPADEPRFVLVAKQMWASGDWLFPHRGIELYPDKPPLFFWLLGASHALIGNWRWSFLLPSLLAGMGTLWLTCDLARRLWNPRAALWAGVAVLSALQFVYQFKRAQIDPTLVLFTTLALYGLCRHLLLGPQWRWFWAACFAAGLGVVLKGVGFLPLLALLPFVLMQRGHWQGMARLGEGNAMRWSLGALAFFAAIALWLVPMVWVASRSGDPEHQAYLQNLLFKQTATRYAEAWHHQQPFWYFLGVIGLFWAPFSLAFPWLCKSWGRAWREHDARVWLPLAWALLVLVFFSASPGKRDMYILPALPAFALAAAPFLDALAARLGFRRILWAFTILLSVLLLALGLSALFSHPKFATALVAERGLGPESRWLWTMLAGVGGIGLILALWLRIRRVLIACALMLALLWCGYGFVVHPVLDASSSARGMMQRARALAGANTEIGLVDWTEQNLLQAVGPTTEFGFRQPVEAQLARGVAWLRAAPGQRLLLLSPGEKTGCLDLASPHSRRVWTANRRDWWLVGADAATACPSAP